MEDQKHSNAKLEINESNDYDDDRETVRMNGLRGAYLHDHCYVSTRLWENGEPF